MKRQRGRNRNGGGTGGGGKPQQQNVNRAFDSNGPDNVKIRGHAQHVFEKYQQLARDSFSSGDRVLAENYLQHADHYFRVLRMLQPQRPAAEILGRDVFTSGLDIDFEDDGEGFEDAAEAGAEQQDAVANGYNGADARDTRSDRDRQDRYESRPDRRDDRFEGRSEAPRTQSFEPRREAEGNRDSRRDNRRFEPRPDRTSRDGQGRDAQARDVQARDVQTRESPSREFQSREGQSREAPVRDVQARDGQSRDGQSRDGQNRDGQSRDGQGRDAQSRGDYRDDRSARAERLNVDIAPQDVERRDPLAVIEPDGAPLMPAAFVDAESSPMLRSEDGGMSEAPAFLQSSATVDDAGETRRPRTRRRRPKALDEGIDDSAPAPAVEDA